MNSLRLRPGGVPLLACPSFLAWYVDGDGIIRATEGTADEGFTVRIEGVLGQHYGIALAGEPGCVRRIERAMTGEPVAEVGEAWGVAWFHVVVPSRCGWGVDGWSTLLPEGIGGAVRSVYESVDCAPEYAIEPGDRFVRRQHADGVSVVRHWSEDRWRDYLADRPDRIRALLSRSAGSPPPVPSAAAPILRLLPRRGPAAPS